MATSSFDKDFTLKSERAVKSFIDIVNNPKSSTKIDRSLTSPDRRKQGEDKLKRIFSR